MFCCSWTTYLEQLTFQSARQGSQLHKIQKTTENIHLSDGLRRIVNFLIVAPCKYFYLLTYLLTVVLFRVDTEASRRWRTPAARRAVSGRLYRTLYTSAPPPTHRRRPHWPSGRQVRRRRLRRDQQHVLASFADNGLRRRQRASFTELQHSLPCSSTCLR